MSYLESKRLYLEKIEFGDEGYLYDLDSNPEVTKYVGGTHYTIEQYALMVERMMNLGWIQNNCGFYKAFLKESDEFIGWFHLRPEDSEPNNYDLLELGYRLKEEFWNNGYASEMSNVLIEKAFKINKCNIVSAITLKENHASSRVMVKCGMEYSNSLIYHGFDCVRYTISKEMFLNA
ncbi:GNAT family N-acetyltransferase [Mycoplasmatota bacterium WC44]